MEPERDSHLPSLKPRRPRRDYGQLLALVSCIVLAIVGALPLGIGALLRSRWVSAWAVTETTRLLAEQGIVASYSVEVRPWPLAVRVHDIKVEASDGGGPVLEADAVSVQPRLFALFSGKLAIDQVEVDEPRLRVVLRKGKLANLDLDLGSKNPPKADEPPTKKAFHAPFSGIAVTDAQLSLDVDGVIVGASGLDLDVTVEDDPFAGSSFEVGLAVAGGQVMRQRAAPGLGDDAPLAFVDEDVLCGLEGRVRLDPDAVLVRRLSVHGAMDLTPAAGTAPRCDLPAEDPRRVDLSLAHFRVNLGHEAEGLPPLSGHARVRAPLGVAKRFVALPDVTGYVDVTTDARFVPGMRLPELSARLAVRGGRFAQFTVGEAIDADLAIRGDVISAPHLSVRLGDGTVTLKDVEVKPFEKTVPLKTKIVIDGVDFTALMRDLGVSDHAHVQWDLVHLEAPNFGGTLSPLHIEGDLAGPTANFAVFDKARDDPKHERVIGVKSAELATRVVVRPESLDFTSVRVGFPNGSLEGGFCSIGFHEDLTVDVQRARLDLVDISPIGDIAMGGRTDLEVHVRGKANNPKVEATGSIADYVLGDLPFGSISHVDAAFQGDVVQLKNIAVTKGRSAYDVPSAKLDFGTAASLVVDAVAASKSFALRDFFSIFDLDEDPRFAELEANLALRAQVHVALGGPEDVCGGGFIDVQAGVAMKDASLLGEHFDEGSGNVTFRWIDQRAGMEGAEIDVRSLVLRKRVLADGTRALGSVLGSASVRRGGVLGGDFVLEAIPLRTLQTAGALAEELEGSVSGFAQVRGTLDSFRLDTEVDVTPVRYRGVSFGSSHLKAAMTQKPSPTKPVGRTRCGGAIYGNFDKEAYLKDTSSHGEILADGTLLGGQVKLAGFAMTRQTVPVIKGELELDKLDIGTLARAATTAKDRDPTAPGAKAPVEFDGELSGSVRLADLAVGGDLARASVRFEPRSLRLTKDGRTVTLRPNPSATLVELARDTLTLPPLAFDLKTPGGFSAAFTARGTASHVTRSPDLDFDLELAPVDLARLPDMMANVERAAGRLEGALKVRGRPKALDVEGQVRLRATELALRGVPMALTDVDVEVRATESELRITRGTARAGSGTLALAGHIPVRDLTLGGAEVTLTARDFRIPGVEGVNGSLDANLALSVAASSGSGGPLPRLSGDVTLTSFDYTRPVNLVSDLAASIGARSLGVKSTRTEVSAVDSSPDSIALDLRIRSRVPLRVRNNLLDLSIAVGSDSLVLTGTDKHPGLSGMLKTLPGGRFKFRSTEFEIRQGIVRFEDPTRITPIVDVTAQTEYRRFQEFGGNTGTRVSGFWRITLHANGDADNLRITMESEPALSQEDILLLLTIGMTRAELDQLQAGSLGTALAFEALASLSGADKAVKTAVPVIDDFRFGSGYSSRAGRTVPQVTLGKRLNEDVRATVTTSIAEDRELRSYVEWRIGQRSSVMGSYDNYTNIAASRLGNIGADFRWRLEFE
jgi:translocation and assembly module TamB